MHKHWRIAHISTLTRNWTFASIPFKRSCVHGQASGIFGSFIHLFIHSSFLCFPCFMLNIVININIIYCVRSCKMFVCTCARTTIYSMKGLLTFFCLFYHLGILVYILNPLLTLDVDVEIYCLNCLFKFNKLYQIGVHLRQTLQVSQINFIISLFGYINIYVCEINHLVMWTYKWKFIVWVCVCVSVIYEWLIKWACVFCYYSTGSQGGRQFSLTNRYELFGIERVASDRMLCVYFDQCTFLSWPTCPHGTP